MFTISGLASMVILIGFLAYVVLFAAEFVIGRRYKKEQLDKAEYMGQKSKLLLAQAVNNCVFSIGCFVLIANQLPSFVAPITFAGFCVVLAVGMLVFTISNNRKLLDDLDAEANEGAKESKEASTAEC